MKRTKTWQSTLWITLLMLLGSAAAQAAPPEKRILRSHDITPGLPTEMSPAARQRMIETIVERRQAKMQRRAAERKIGSALRDVTRALEKSPTAASPLFKLDAAGNLRIEIRVAEVGWQHFAALHRLGLEVSLTDGRGSIVYAGIPTEGLGGRLARVAALPWVESVRPALGDLVHTGSVVTEGDAVHGADQARLLLGVDGTGVKVCVISDGMVNAASSVASGDLPDDGTGQPLVDLCPINDNSGDEGTAMLEIVHDIAPGSKLGFCPAFSNTVTGPQSIADAIDTLAQAGCDVIVDDVANLTEPYFQDGVVAQSVDAAVAAGIAYFSSAGNSGDNHYEARYRDTNPGDDLVFPLDVHDFGLAAGGASDTDWAGLVGPGGNFFAAFLQWSDAFGASGNDYDLYLFDAGGLPAGDPAGVFPVGGLGLDVQDGDDDPAEVAFVVNNTGANQTFFIVIDRFSGDSAKALEMNFNGFFTVAVPENYNIAAGSVWGHSAAKGAQAIAATGAVINVDGTPNPNHDIIEPFSSRGPAILFFDAAGNPVRQRRRKPELTAVDGVSVTGAGGFPSTFFGTSAAAPHAAAFAALMLEASPTLTPRGVLKVFANTTADHGAPGFDPVWGYGFIDAFLAVRLALTLP